MPKELHHGLLLASVLLLFIGLFLLPGFFPFFEGGSYSFDITGAVSLTGAAIADIKQGKVTYISLAFLLFILTNTLALLGFASYFFKKIQNNHIEFQTKEALIDVVTKLTSFFVRDKKEK